MTYSRTPQALCADGRFHYPMVNIIDVARVGRKYGVGIGFLCNSPYDLKEELLVQCPVIVPVSSGFFITNYSLIKKRDD